MDIGPTLQRLSQEPDLWENLQKAGFFLVNFSEGFQLNSQLIVDLGYAPETLSDGQFSAQLHPEDEGQYRSLWQRVVSGWEDVFHAEYRIKDLRSGDWCWLQSHGVVLSRRDGQIAIYAGVDQNITARKASEAIARQQLSDIETVFHQAESLRVASMLANSTLDLDKTIQLVLSQAQGLLPFQKAAVSRFVGDAFQDLGSLADADQPPGIPERPRPHPVWAVVGSKSPGLHDDLGSLEPPFPGDPLGRYRSWIGIPLIFRNELLGVLEFWHSEPGFFHSEQIWPAMGFADSVAESLSNSEKYEALREDARTDPLTGLFSRRYLQNTGPDIIERSFREQRPLAILILDIDHFKDINDNHGHLVGDAVLMTIAQLCRNLLRREDLFYRYGGEEFIAILPDTDAPVAHRIAERLRETAAAARFRDIRKGVTISIGVAPVAPGHGVSFEEALGEADQAMYQAKEQGRDRVVLSGRWADPMVSRTDF